MRFFRCRGLTCEWQSAARGPIGRCERADIARVLGKSDRDDFRNFAAEAKRGLGYLVEPELFGRAVDPKREDMKVHIRSSAHLARRCRELGACYLLTRLHASSDSPRASVWHADRMPDLPFWHRRTVLCLFSDFFFHFQASGQADDWS